MSPSHWSDSSRPVRVAIQDANILIDLELSGMLPLWFQLGIETHTSVFIQMELENGGHAEALAFLKSGAIQTHPFSASEMDEILVLLEQAKNRASFNDCSVLFLALRHKAMLLSGDQALVKSAKGLRVETHGTLWIFDLLVEHRILCPSIAAAKMRVLLEHPRRLPRTECERRIREWLACPPL